MAEGSEEKTTLQPNFDNLRLSASFLVLISIEVRKYEYVHEVLTIYYTKTDKTYRPFRIALQDTHNLARIYNYD